MAIITETTTTQITLPKAQKIKLAKQQIDSAINALFRQMKTVYSSNFDKVWDSEDYTAAELLALYGKDGVELFRLSACLRDTLESVKTGTVPTDKMNALKPVTFNNDGSVIVGE